jgi:hypothetical protein
LIAIVLAAVDLAVPYLFLGASGSFAASFLFWCALTLVVIVAAAFYTRHWSKE